MFLHYISQGHQAVVQNRKPTIGASVLSSLVSFLKLFFKFFYILGIVAKLCFCSFVIFFFPSEQCNQSCDCSVQNVSHGESTRV